MTQFQNLNKEEIRKQYIEIQSKSSSLDNLQLALKILMNSLYGCLANEHFRDFDIRLAQSITESGRRCIQYIGQYVNDYLKDKYGDTLVYCDTDSVAGDTIVNINGKDLTIEQFYDQTIGEVKNNNNSKYVKIPDQVYKTPSYSNETGMISDTVNYIMKHKVKKRMYEIIVDGKSIRVTEDHSIMVERNDELISIKPKDIKNTDLIIIKDI